MAQRIWDVIKGEIGVEIEEIDQSHDSLQADIFNKLKVRKDQVPIRPLTEGKLEWYVLCMLLIIGNI